MSDSALFFFDLLEFISTSDRADVFFLVLEGTRIAHLDVLACCVFEVTSIARLFSVLFQVGDALDEKRGATLDRRTAANRGPWDELAQQVCLLAPSVATVALSDNAARAVRKDIGHLSEGLVLRGQGDSQIGFLDLALLLGAEAAQGEGAVDFVHG